MLIELVQPRADRLVGDDVLAGLQRADGDLAAAAK